MNQEVASARTRATTRRERLLAAAALVSRRKRSDGAISPSFLGGPVEQSASPRVVLQGDFTIVGSSAGTEVEITRDADGKMRIFSVGAGGTSQWKQPVRVASTANVNISNGLEAGDSIDSVTLAAGDRVLLKNQSDLKENGIYVAPASGAASRATDADVGSELVHAVVGVEEGITNADKFFVCFTNAPITVGVTSMSWASLLSMIQGAEEVHTHSGDSVSLDAGAWVGFLAGSGVTTVQELADFLDANITP